ncbi:MAG TPA: 4'-phosphopantetheinyl transferase superfamily protein [Saprospiraceae bacterium]|nr:4'-phosphopantetheinyl transferase superfamily protein [Saprospiraceae bacterium]
MPLFKQIQPDNHTQVLVWEITESKEDLRKGLVLEAHSKHRIKSMRSEMHQRGYLSVRHLLKEAGYCDSDLFYTDDGKPHLRDGKRISITHSFSFSAIAISNSQIGIDIEKNREKIIKIAPKFVADEFDFMAEDNVVAFLTVVWGAKESLFKIHPDGGLLFKHHLPIEPFKLSDLKTRGWIKKDNYYEVYHIFFESFKGFTLVYAIG